MAQPVGLDLIAPELFAPMLRRLTLVAVGVGVVAALVLALVVSWPLAILAGLALGAPTALYAMAVRRRRMWLVGNELRARTLFGSRRLDVAAATGVEVLVYPGRLSRIVVRITAGRDSQIVPLAMYTDSGSGRELHILGLRTLADALARSELAAALAVSAVLIAQLRAEARDAPLEQRPLYRAVRLVRARDIVQPIVLADSDIAALA
ncbi:hypothetical protein NDR87_12775 [Nocardia sp. CDC159]|uniref:Uncharacterized protein n=1 Tax=Nocardia pulmonis TaxID=2951408 RepID=A0A9X2E5P5_9NOCA|nr:MULTISPECIES: hypothetical protein [Nocardia]MCM6774704.1 hypothetical protein [Nocardia pulmonis]MCM6787231.1 hypothetical protein [Nocardia sp. CDC159]